MAGRLWSSRLLGGVFATVWLIASFLVSFVHGQAASAAAGASPHTVVDVLQQMSGRAGVIFVGQVVAVRPSGSSGAVEIDFRVDNAIRGCALGVYTLREWAGLWVVDNQRYHVGQRLLMLLHAPGAAGLSSPVDGLDGAIPIRQGGSATPYAGSVASARFVDLRWLGAKLPHVLSYRSESSGRAKSVLPPIPFVATSETVVAMRAAGSTGSVAAITPLSGDVAGGSVPAQQASVGAVLGMLATWEKARHAAP